MDNNEFYQSLPVDLSGSRSKNRFRLELLWGLGKLIDLMDTADDFTVVFDYVCDIEVHLPNGFEFYQLKTHSSSMTSYTISQLTTKEKQSSEGSILGKLFLLKSKDKSISTRIAVVSNIPISVGKKKCEALEVALTDLPADIQKKIIDALHDEIQLSQSDLVDVLFIRSHMNFAEPQNELAGKLSFSFERIKGYEPHKPNSLYRLVADVVQEKACYEYSDKEYEQIVKHKGITRAEFMALLDRQAKDEITGIEGTQKYIRSMSLNVQHKYNVALSDLMLKLNKSRLLAALEKEIALKVIQLEPQNIELGIDMLIPLFHDRFPPEIDNVQKTVFYVIVLNKYAEGGYCNEDDF